MAREELLRTLEKLHSELSQNPQLDEGTLQSMRAIVNEIQLSIANSVNDKSEASPKIQTETPFFTERLQDLITRFEARHPQITATLSNIADRLTDMGI